MTHKEEQELKLMYKNDVESTLDQLIKYLRHKEKTESSGIQELLIMVQDGSLHLSKAISILPVVKNYNNPYEINLI